MIAIVIRVPDENVANYIREQIDSIVEQYINEKDENKDDAAVNDRIAALEKDLAYARKMRFEAEENEGIVRRKLAEYESFFSHVKTANKLMADRLMSFPEGRVEGAIEDAIRTLKSAYNEG